MVTFRVAKHNVLPDTDVVEILVDGELAGMVYPTEDGQGVKLMSKHLTVANLLSFYPVNQKAQRLVGEVSVKLTPEVRNANRT